MTVALVLLGLLALALVGAAAWLYRPDTDRTTLEAAYAAPPSQFMDILGVRLHIRDTGPRDAPAILMLHGFGASLHTWDAWSAALSPTRRTIRIDLPGFGLTGRDPSGDYTDARTVQVILALLDRLNLAQVDLVGNSMGGRFAWRFAVAHPDRVGRLVLISPDGFASPGIAYGQRPSVPTLARLLPYVLPDGMLRANLAPSYADPALLTPETFARYRDMLLAPGVRQAILDRMGQSVLPDPVPMLRTLQTPTLLIWGENDRLIPFRNAADWMAALPNARLAALPGQGHVPQEEVPALSLAPLLRFLDP